MNTKQHRISSVTFETVAQKHTDGQFSVPVEVASILGLVDGEEFVLTVHSSKGTKTLIKDLRSGTEVYGGLKEHISSGEKIVVQIEKLNT